MLMHIRRPFRGEPLPLGERTSPDPAVPAGDVWLNVRPKRSRPAAHPARKPYPTPRRSSSSPEK